MCNVSKKYLIVCNESNYGFEWIIKTLAAKFEDIEFKYFGEHSGKNVRFLVLRNYYEIKKNQYESKIKSKWRNRNQYQILVGSLIFMSILISSPTDKLSR